MDTGWIPGGKQKQRSAPKDTLDDFIGDLLNDDPVPQKKKSTVGPTTGKNGGPVKKSGSKEGDFYSSLALAAEDDLSSDVSEADVNQVAQSIKDLEDLDADLFGGSTGKTPKKGSLKDKSGKSITPRRTGTPRSRSTTPNASSPQHRATPVNKVTSPTHMLASVTKPTSPPGRETSTSMTPTQKPNTAPARHTDISETVKPGQMNEERPKTAPKARKYDFGEFDETDPLAGIPLSDDEDLSLKETKEKEKRPALKPAVSKQLSKEEPQRTITSPPPSTTTVAAKKEPESPRKKNLFDRPPTRSGSTDGTSTLEKDDSSKPKPAITKKKSEEMVFSDDDDFLGGLGIEDMGTKAVASVKAKPTEIEDEEKPAKSIFDKLLSRDTVSKHLETNKERREFVLDQKFSKPGGYAGSGASQREDGQEEDFQFGGYMPSAVSTTGSRPGSRRSVRFQDEEDDLSRPSTGSLKKPEGMEWLEISEPKTPAKQPLPKKEIKPAKPLSSPADWLGLKEDEDRDKNNSDYLLSSSVSAPAIGRGKSPAENEKKKTVSESVLFSQPQVKTQMEIDQKKAMESRPIQSAPSFPTKTDSSIIVNLGVSSLQTARPTESKNNDDYLGLGREIDPSTLLRTKQDSPVFGGAIGQQEFAEDLFTPPSPPPSKSGSIFDTGAMKTRQAREKTDGSTTRQDPIQSKSQIENAFDIGSPRIPISQQISHLKSLEDQEASSSQPVRGRLSKETSVLHGPSSREMSPLRSREISPLRSRELSPIRGKTSSPFPSSGVVSHPPESHTDFFSFKTEEIRETQARIQELKQLQQQQQLQQQLQQQQQQLQQQQELQQRLQKQQQQQIKLPTQVPSLLDRPLFPDMYMAGSNLLSMDAQAQVRRMELELQYAHDLLKSTKKRYEEEIAAVEKSYKTRIELIEETNQKREQRWSEENEQLHNQQLIRIRQMEEEKAALMSKHYQKLEQAEHEKAEEIERLKEIHKQALEQMRHDQEESLGRLKRSKDQQIEAAAESHNTSKSLMAAVDLIQSNAKDLGSLQRKMDTWHNQGLDEREIMIRSKDEQLNMLSERLNKQQEENDKERLKLQDLIARLETQLREQNRMLEEERWKVKKDESRIESMQKSLEEERRMLSEHQVKERASLERNRDALLEEQRSLLSQLHKERQALAEERMQFELSQKMTKEETQQYTSKLVQIRAEYEILMKAIAEDKQRFEEKRAEFKKDEQQIREQWAELQKERSLLKDKEEEMMNRAHMLKERSAELDDFYRECQHKYEEGMQAREDAQVIEAEEKQRLAAIQQGLNNLRAMEKEMAEERLQLSKDKREIERFRRSAVEGSENLHQLNGYGTTPGLLMPAYQPTYTPHLFDPALQLSINTVDNVTESIKNDRSIRMWKVEAMKDQQFLEEQSLFLYALKHMPYNKSPQSSS
ncbi:hypothetical protein CHS0354_034532 [Potamilus streckersoni]|uniref:Fas-binding factor 1 C-terminal domain-containing protein n=1 Tax=Potamilus streckersoni TaxID=2493646 RepID=A0AAE0SF93_9BIVA|nr:hypothetical protein CHS0354_034532 [Potamilus streckersoni]